MRLLFMVPPHYCHARILQTGTSFGLPPLYSSRLAPLFKALVVPYVRDRRFG
jgi:hypothetical protein